VGFVAEKFLKYGEVVEVTEYPESKKWYGAVAPSEYVLEGKSDEEDPVSEVLDHTYKTSPLGTDVNFVSGGDVATLIEAP